MYKSPMLGRLVGQAYTLEAAALQVCLFSIILFLFINLVNLLLQGSRLQSTAAQPSDAALARQKIKEKVSVLCHLHPTRLLALVPEGDI